jgi:hypothetical protein
MPKLALTQVSTVLKRHALEPAVLREMLEELRALTEAEATEPKPRAEKRQFVFLLSDATGLIAQRIDPRNLVGWVVQIPDSESPHTLPERIHRTAYEFNASKRGRLLPVKSIAEALESCPSKMAKEQGLHIKTKLPITVLLTDNILPRAEA